MSSPDARLHALAILLSVDELAILARAPALSNQERAVFVLTGRGLKPKAIAADLAISAKTVETYLAQIRSKFGGEGRPITLPDLIFLARMWVRAHDSA